MSLGMYGQGQGAGRPPSNNPFGSMPSFMQYGTGGKGWKPDNVPIPQYGTSLGQSNYTPQNVNQPASNGSSGGSFLDGIGGMLGSATGLGGLLGGVTGLLGALGHSNLDLGEQRKQLGALSGNFQERGQEAWDFGKGLREGKGQFYDTAKNEIGRQMDVGMDAQRTNAMVGVNSASAYRRSLGDLQRKMYEQLGSSMNQMYATGLQQSSQYGALASDLWRNRIGAESAIADMHRYENESSNAIPSQLMNMGGGLLGGLFGGILG